MNRHNIEILVEIVTRHPIEVGEQHAVAVIDVVQIGIVHGIDEVAERVLFNVRLNASGVVHNVELDMVLLCRQPPQKRKQQNQQQYRLFQVLSAHSLTFDSFAVVTLPRGILLNVVSCTLGGGGVPMRLMLGAHPLVFGGIMRRLFRRLTSPQSEHQH